MPPEVDVYVCQRQCQTVCGGRATSSVVLFTLDVERKKGARPSQLLHREMSAWRAAGRRRAAIAAQRSTALAVPYGACASPKGREEEQEPPRESCFSSCGYSGARSILHSSTSCS